MKQHMRVLFSVALLARISLAKESQEPKITYQVIPELPNQEQSMHSANVGAAATRWAAGEARVAEAEQKTAADTAVAAAAHKEALEKVAASTVAMFGAHRAAEETIKMRHDTEEAVHRQRAVVDSIPKIAHAAAVKATNDVEMGITAELEKEVTATALKAKEAERLERLEAAKESQRVAMPFQQAKLRAEQSIVSYAARARELATAVIHLKGKALKIAADSNQYQQLGNVVMAQQEQMKAHDLLDKALQMEGVAKGFQDTANKINGEMGDYDLSIAAAAESGGYQGNPGGARPPWPAPPKPLKLKLPVPGPGPAPAPAPAR